MVPLRRLWPTLCVLSFSLAAHAAAVPQPVEQLRQSYERAYNAGDAAGIGALLTDDAQWLPPAEAPVVGKAAVQRRYASQFTRSRSVFHLRIDDFRQSGELAVIEGPYERTDAGGQGSTSKTYSGKYLMVLQRQPDGSWKIARDIWNGDRSPGATLDVDAKVALNDFRAVEQRLASVARLFSVFYALDAKGQTALHRDPALRMEYPSDLGDPSLRSAVQEMRSRPEGVVRYTFRGVEKTVLYAHSRPLGWVFALGFEVRPPAGGH